MSMLQMIFLCWGLTSEPENICPPLPIEQFWNHGPSYEKIEFNLQPIRDQTRGNLLAQHPPPTLLYLTGGTMPDICIN